MKIHTHLFFHNITILKKYMFQRNKPHYSSIWCLFMIYFPGLPSPTCDLTGKHQSVFGCCTSFEIEENVKWSLSIGISCIIICHYYYSSFAWYIEPIICSIPYKSFGGLTKILTGISHPPGVPQSNHSEQKYRHCLLWMMFREGVVYKSSDYHPALEEGNDLLNNHNVIPAVLHNSILYCAKMFNVISFL